MISSRTELRNEKCVCSAFVVSIFVFALVLGNEYIIVCFQPVVVKVVIMFVILPLVSVSVLQTLKVVFVTNVSKTIGTSIPQVVVR